MRFLTIILASIVLLGQGCFTVRAASPMHETEFFMLVEDMPLMTGLVELQDETLSFDKPEGRIIESYASMENITRQQVVEYYKVILPQFGWGRVKDNVFFRAHEYLELSFVERAGKAFLRVTVRPTL